MLVSDLITGAFEDIGVITVNETVSPAMQTDAFSRLNLILDSLSAEGLVVPNQVMQPFSLQANVTAYTLGNGGSFPTTGGLRAVKITAWRAYLGTILQSGGRALSMAEFGEAAKQLMGETTPIPGIVGADTSFPLINVRVFPPPSSPPGTIELSFWTPLLQFASVGDTINLAQGLPLILRTLLAADLYQLYPRPNLLEKIIDAAKNAKAAVIEQNAMTSPEPTPAAPQGQK
jgi:hypothetical protein